MYYCCTVTRTLLCKCNRSECTNSFWAIFLWDKKCRASFFHALRHFGITTYMQEMWKLYSERA